MSVDSSAPREWPPVDLIAGLSLETIAEPEAELDENVLSSKNYPPLPSKPRVLASFKRLLQVRLDERIGQHPACLLFLWLLDSQFPIC